MAPTYAQRDYPPIPDIERVGVIGAGQMGGGIAQVAAQAGYQVRLLDVSPQALAKLMALVQKLSPQIKEAVGADGVLIAQFNGAAAGQTVFHLHVHIIPRKEGEALKPHAGKMGDQAKLAATAEKIRKTLSA